MKPTLSYLLPSLLIVPSELKEKKLPLYKLTLFQGNTTDSYINNFTIEIKFSEYFLQLHTSHILKIHVVQLLWVFLNNKDKQYYFSSSEQFLSIARAQKIKAYIIAG